MVELIIVISLIVVLASLAMTVSLRARAQSNEAAAIGNLRTVSSAAEAFRSAQNPPAYPPDLAQMVTSNPPYIDSGWTNNQRQGYIYTYVAAGSGDTFSLSAAPRTPNVTGVNSYCVDQTGVIRRFAGGGAVGGAAGCNAAGTPI